MVCRIRSCTRLLWNPILLAALALLLLAPLAARAQAQATGNLRVTVQLIEADGFTDTDPRIADVVGQLEQLFRFDGYRLLSEATLLVSRPTVDGPDEYATQRIAPTEERVFDIELYLSNPGAGDAVRAGLLLEDRFQGSRVLEVGVNVRPGQTVVLGSARYAPDQPTLIVVLRMAEAGV